MIYVVGDSHSSIFANVNFMIEPWMINDLNYLKNQNSEYFKVFRIGAYTAMGLSLNKDKLNDVLNLYVDKKKDKVLLSFGEVDIRAHVMKRVSSGANIITETMNVVEEYFKTILYYKNLGYNLIIWGLIASHLDDYKGVTYGTNKNRNEATSIFNDNLEKLCKKHKITFVSMFKEMLNEDGTTKPNYFDHWKDTHCHLHPKNYYKIVELFKEKKII